MQFPFSLFSPFIGTRDFSGSRTQVCPPRAHITLNLRESHPGKEFSATSIFSAGLFNRRECRNVETPVSKLQISDLAAAITP